ncbi:MAG: SDR family oxidoreductase [Alphaproteobacteria bacterium]|nr:SDR family oxidoreductase [Alphaproteobacteria bacterium]
MSTVLITGAGRGLGLEFARQYAGAGWNVIATCRDDAGEAALRAIRGNIEIFDLDVARADAVAALQAAMADRAIDVLINNAGVLHAGDGGLGTVDEEMWDSVVSINAYAPFNIVGALWPNVAKSTTRNIVAISSDMASMAMNDSGGMAAYRASKAALNSLMRTVSVELAPHGITTVMIHPGWVRTDMGGAGGDLEVHESVTEMRAVIASLTPHMNGRFFRYDGRELEW